MNVGVSIVPTFLQRRLGFTRNFMGLSFGVYPMCFPAHSTVQLANGSTRAMKDLSIGDEVVTMDKKQNNTVKSEKIIAWLHRDTNMVGDFLDISLASGTRIAISPNHFIMRAATKKSKKKQYEYVAASEIKPGDLLFQTTHKNDGTITLMPVPVQAVIILKNCKGVYAPATKSGTLLVDNVICSCYAQYDRVTSHKIAHASLAPLRWSGATQEDYTSGIHPYCQWNMKLYECYRRVMTM